MTTENPYESPSEHFTNGRPRQGFKKLGTILLVVGIASLAYGAIGFWVVKSLPPNGASGRLPSVYVMGVGIVITLVGSTIRDFRVSGKKKPVPDQARE